MSMFEPLESRALFSASPLYVPGGYASVKADYKDLPAEIRAGLRQSNRDVKAIDNALDAVGKAGRKEHSFTNPASFELAAVVDAAFYPLKTDLNALGLLKSDINALRGLGAEIDPGFGIGLPAEIAADRADITADLATLTQRVNADASAMVTAIRTEVQDLSSTNSGVAGFSSVAAKLVNDANTTENTITGEVTSLTKDVNNLNFSETLISVNLKNLLGG